ncbi:MAG: hypothetical protein OEZ39_00235 [Gammaproteobacteria bacterium]|nr:hypothetical protein [Gammaproteobacteria bacterium]MDH5650275.1 hypothetical protein [Gammaproteobacteria bacterium]
MNNSIQHAYRYAVRWCGSVLLVPILLLSVGCSSTKLTVIGQEHQLTREESGNIAGEKAETTLQRSKVLGDVLIKRYDDLTSKDISRRDLAFAPYGESTIILPDGQTHVLVVLYQTYKGARIMEGLQYGSFDLKSGELRTVRAHLQKTSDLPDPPGPDLKTWSAMHNVFRAYLKQQGHEGISFSISDKPVVSAQLKVGGYLVQYSYRNENNSLSRFAGIIEPGTERVHVLYDITTD